jgi:ABC-type nickel/cobalt efflux system permease component RcnA
MKALNLIAWISGGIAALIVLLAVVSLLSGKILFGLTHVVNYFHAANSFLLITIALFIYIYRCECKKE